MRPLLLILLLTTGLGLTAAEATTPAPAETGHQHAPVELPAYEAWPEAAIGILRTLPVQEAGRIKPLSTAAAFTLLRLSGRRSLDHEEQQLEPTAWAMDCFFRPEHAEAQALFQIQTSEVLDAIGVEHEGRKKRDRYSYNELAPGRRELMRQAQQISQMEEAERDYIQRQVLDLASNLLTFEAWLNTGAFAQSPMPLHEVGPLLAPFLTAQPSVEQLTASGLSEHHARSMLGIMRFVRGLIAHRSAPAVLPPLDADEEAWLGVTEFLGVALGHGGGQEWTAHWTLLERWQAAHDARDDATAFTAAVDGLHAHVVGMARARGEYGMIPAEVAYYRADLLSHALVLFILGFIAVALLWLKPRSRWLAGSAWTFSSIALLLVIAAITWRCILRGRPPVTTLYETVLFITATAVLVDLAAEWITRQRIALSLAPLLGAAGLFLAFRYETLEASDTMPQLVAVLDTNFWLATHVTTVTLGYAAGLLAGILGALYLLGRLFRLRLDDRTFYRTIAQSTYGVICFGLVFSVVGTILGGIWANDSWGRFWGWDPKENGALMIVLAELAILHARLTGWIRERGLCLSALGVFAVVVFSWWHVNQLGAGLHSYGHTDGVMRAIQIAYASVLLVAVLGTLGIWLDRRRERRPSPTAGS